MGTNKLDWVRAKRRQSATFLKKYIEEEDGQWQAYEEILQTRSTSSLSKTKNKRSSSSLPKIKTDLTKLINAPEPAISLPQKKLVNSFSLSTFARPRQPSFSNHKPPSEVTTLSPNVLRPLPGEIFRKRAETLKMIEDERQKVDDEFQEKLREARELIKKNNVALEHREFAVLNNGFEKWKDYVKSSGDQTLKLLQQWRFERLRLLFAHWNLSTRRHARAVAILRNVQSGMNRDLCCAVFRDFRRICGMLRIRKQRILRVLTLSAIVIWRNHARQSQDTLQHSLVSPSECRRKFLLIIAIWRLTKMCHRLSRRKTRNRERVLVTRFRTCIIANFFEDWRTHTFKKYVAAEKIAKLLQEANKSQIRRAICTWFAESKNGPKRRKLIGRKVQANRNIQLKTQCLKKWLERYNELVKDRMAVLHWAEYKAIQSFSKWLLHVTTMRKLRGRAMSFDRRRVLLKHIRVWKQLLDSLPCDADRYTRAEYKKQRPAEYRMLELNSRKTAPLSGWTRLIGRRYQERNIRVITTMFHFS